MSTTGQITLRYWASAAAAAGVDSDLLDVDGPVPLATLKQRAVGLHEGRKFRDVIGCCSVLIGDRPANGNDDVLVDPGSSVEFLPPFAGG
jgi:sulfur-carrier protein